MTSLSDQERAYWIDWQRDPKSTAYVLALAGERKAPFDREGLRERLTKAIRSHASLRTLFTSRGETVLLEGERAKVEIESVPFGGGDRDDAALVTRSLQAFAFRPFALDADLLVRAGVMTLPGGSEVLVLAAHHAALDYVAMRLLWNEISGNGPAASGGEIEKDVVRAERPRDRAYWMRTLAGGWPTLDLGGARSRRGLGALLRHEGALTSSITAALRTRAREEGVSVSSLVFLAWGEVLMEAGAADEVTIGLLANMRRSRSANAIGSFVNTLPIRFHRGATPRDVHTGVLGGLAHRHVSLGEILASIAHERGAPLQATYNYFAGDPGVVLAGIGRKGGSLPFEGGELRTVEVPPIHAHSELSLLVGDLGEELLLTIDVSSSMYPRALLRTLGARLETRLAELATNRGTHASPLQCVHVFAPFTADPVGEPLRFLLREAEVLRRVQVHAPAEFFPTLVGNGFPNEGEIVLLLEGREEALGNAPLLIEAIGRLAPRSPVVIMLPGAEGESGEARGALMRGIEAVGVPTWDIDLDVSSYGVSRIFEPAAEAHAQIPFTDEMFAVMALRTSRVVRAGLQPPMKVIAVDGDETLWRGVVGEVGPEGISFDGAPKVVQQFLKERRRDGFLLSLVSKNVEADARAALLHKDSILRWEDFAAHRVGWSDKSDSLLEIAAELNAGLDAFVFLDDSAAECEHMRLALPEVEVVELRGDAREQHVRLTTDWHFDLPPSTAVDARRTEMLAEERARQKVRAHVSTLDELVTALNVEVSISPMLDTEVARVAQLTQRTNQFNTTTQRCSEAEVRARKGTWVVRVTDRFGDYGLAGAMVLVPSNDPRMARIDAWMLSCRVLGRGVERALVHWLRGRGIERVVIPYVTTLRNVPAMQLLARMAEAALPSVGEVDVLLTDALVQRLSMLAPREVAGAPVRAIGSTVSSGATPDATAQTATTPMGSDPKPALLKETPLKETGSKETLPRFDSARALLEAIRGPLQAIGDAERPSGFLGEVFDVWREAIGEAPSRWRSFFAQGGSSLAAVQMLVQLERRTGLRCDLALLFAHPTFLEFAEFAERSIQRDPYSTASLVSRQEPDALSATQLAVFAFMQRHPSSLAYHVPLLMKVSGSLDLAALSSAWKAIVIAEPALRSAFVLGPKGPSCEVTETEVPLRVTEPPEHDAWLVSRLSEPFDVSRAPLCRLEFATTPRGTYLSLVAHHLVIDGPSLARLGAVLVERMSPAAPKSEAPLTNLPHLTPREVRLASHASGELRGNSKASFDADLFAAWTPRRAGPPKLHRATRALPNSVALREQARENGTTLFALLASALAWTLFALRGTSRVGFGTIVQRSIGRELGLHGELVALPFVAPEASEFHIAMRALCTQTMTALGECASAPLAEVVLVEEASPAVLSIGTAELRFVDTAPLEPQFAARFFARTEGDDGFVLGVDVDTTRFSRGEAEAALARWAQVIESIGQRVAPSMFLPGEEEALRRLGRGEEVAYPWQGGVVAAWFASIDGSARGETERVSGGRSGERPSERVALVGDEVWSYAELASRVAAIVEMLRASGVERGDRVGVCMQRSAGLVAALHGVVAAGAAYVALEPELPGERLAWMANNAGCLRILCDEAGEKILSSAGIPPAQLLKNPEAKGAASFVPEQMEPNDLMYVLYTSGSTGRPKGVEVTHGGVWNRLLWQRDTFGADTREVVLQKTPFGFDVSVWELFWPMLLGGRLVVLKAGEHRDPEAVIARVRKESVTTLHFVPSMLRVFLDWEGVETLHSLRRVVCSGEALRPGDVVRLRARLPNVEIWNLYGPTEASVDVTWWKAPEVLGERCEVPIGRPVSNTALYVVGPSGKLALRGAAGELLIAGAQVARGYAANPDETRARFLENALDSGLRAYRTGDQVRWSEEGELLYIGRLDGQVKVRGQRVELGEIEASLEQHPAVQAAACVIDAEHSRITAFVVLREQCSPSDLRAYLATRLSEAMRPTSITPVESLPLGPSGKVDRARLRSLGPVLTKTLDTPASEKEENLAAAFGAVLGISEVPLEESFFALGGDSLSAMRLVVAARARGLRLQVTMLYEAPSVRALAKIAGAASDESETLPELPELPMARWFREYAGGDALFLQIVRVQFDAPVPLETLETALTVLSKQHPALSIPSGSGRRGMRIAKENTNDASPIDEACAEMIGPQDAGVFLVRTCNDPRALLAEALTIAAHHEVIDGFSWHVLLSDLREALSGTLVARGSEMGRASVALEAWRNSPSAEHRREEARTLLRALPAGAWTLGEEKPVSTHRLALTLPGSRSAVELEVLESLLLAALTSALSEYGEGPCVVGVEGHGRDAGWAESLDLSGEIGWFSCLDPVLIVREKWAGASVVRARASLDARVHDWLSLELDREFPRIPVCLNLLGDLTLLAPKEGSVTPSFGRIAFSALRPKTRPFGLEVMAWISEQSLHVEWIGPELGFMQFGAELRKLLAVHEAEAAHGERLSPAQEGIWTACERDPSRDLYVEQFSTTLSGPFSLDRFTRALEETIRAQPVLRTAFQERRSKSLPEEASPGIVVDALRLELHAAGGSYAGLEREASLRRSAESPAETFAALCRAERARGFDLSSPPLFRVLLVETSPQVWAIAFTYHHLLLDGWSVPLVLDAILARYHQRSLPTSTLARDHVRMSRSRAIRYWHARLAGLRNVTPPPLPREKGGASNASATYVEPGLQRQIDAFARKSGTSVHTVLFGAFLLWLREAHLARRVCIAIAVSGREGPGAEERIGMWMNTLPFEASFDPTQEVSDWLLGVQRQLIRDQIYGSLGLREMLGPSLPVPEALFVYENYPKQIGASDGLTIGAFSYARRVEFPFAMVVTPGDRMHMELLAEGISPESLAAAMNGYLDLLLRMCAADLRPMEFAKGEEDAITLSTSTALGRANNAGATELERTIASVWSAVLGVPSLSSDAEFFKSGGDSLQAAAVVGRLRKLLRRDISVRTLFDHPRLDAFARAVRAAHESTTIADEGPKRDPNGIGRVSLEQERLYFLEQLAGGEALYHLPCALRIDGPLDVAKLRLAIVGVVRRHESLRTVFASSAEGVTATILPREWADEFPIEVTTCAGEAEALALLSQRARAPFDLSRGPLLRVVLVELSREVFWLGLTVHHIVADGWSIPILVREVLALYGGRALPELPIQYSDYARWQRRTKTSAACEERWRGRMKGAPELLPLPTRQARPKRQSFKGEHLPFDLRGATLRQLERAAREEGVTPFMWLLAVLDVLLARLSGTEDIVVGCSTAHRTTPALEPLVGFFVHLAVVRVEVTGTFRGLLSEVRARVLDATEDPIPFERLVELSGVERTLSHSPVFQVNLVYQNVPPGEAEGGVKVTPALLETGTSRFDLALIIEPSRDALAGVLEFNTDVFDAPFARLFVAAFDALLEASLADPDANVFALPVSAQDQRHLDAGAPRRERAEVLAETFARVAAERGDATALRIESAGSTRSWSYSTLEQVSRRYALGLRARGVGPNVLVAIAKARSLDTIALLIAVVRLGAAFMPIDVEIPAARAARQMEIAHPALVVADAAWLDEMPSHFNAITAEECLEGAAESDGAEGSKAQFASPSHAAPQDRAYVIFTSGSTGVPRGVNVSYEGLPNLIAEQARVFGIDANAVVLQFSSLGFDASISEVFVTLFSGAILDLGCEDDRRNLPRALLRVTHVTLPPAVLAVLDPRAYPNLRVVVSAGEALSSEVARRWLSDGRRLINAYGPTEATVCTTMHEVKEEDLGGSVPLGAPMGGVRALVTDALGNALPEGFAGELVVVGPSVALGYVGDAQATEERFGLRQGERFYRTGDRVRALGGHLFFLGRADEQVKLHGYRIELGEIAALACRVAGVRDARACVQEGSLLLFVLSDGSEVRGEGLVSRVRASLAENVPHYMVPSRIFLVEDWPLNAHGKVDQGALLPMLPSLEHVEEMPGASNHDVSRASPVDAPSNEVEGALCRLFGEVLHREVSALGGFFELGGDSIGSIQLVSRALAEGISFGVRDVFLYPTPRALAAHAKLVKFAPLAAPPVQGEVPLTMQERWFLSLTSGMRGHYQQAVAFQWPSCNVEALAKAVSVATGRYDVLCASFHERDGAWTQTYQAVAPLELMRIQVESIGPEGESEEVAAFVERPFELDKAPLMRMAVFLPKTGPLVWAVAAHHLIIDAMSMRILLEDVLRAYVEPEKPLTDRIASFAAYASYAPFASDLGGEQNPTRHSDRPSNPPAASRPLGPPGERGEASVWTCEVRGVAPDRAAIMMLAGVGVALAEEGWSLPIDVETTGRDSGPFGRTLGWLTRRKEVHLPAEWLRAPNALLEVERALNAAKELGLSRCGAEVAINYLGRLDPALPPHPALADLGLLSSEHWVLEHPTTERPYAIECLAWMYQDRLCVKWISSRALMLASQRMVRTLESWLKTHTGTSEFVSSEEANLVLAELSELSP